MIKNVLYNETVTAGETIILNVDADYPIVIEVYCFRTQPKPPQFLPCPNSGSHTIAKRQPFEFRTHENTFASDGRVDFNIIDARGNSRKIEVKVKSNKGFTNPIFQHQKK